MADLRKYWTVAKVNFRNIKSAYLVTGICLLLTIVDFIIDIAFNTSDFNITPSNYLYLLCVLAPILIASGNYGKFMNIGVKKKVYLWGCALNYIVISAFVSLICAAGYFFSKTAGISVISLVEIFGWNANIFTAFFSSFAFLLLAQMIIHTLTFMQTKWYGWAADLLIAALIGVFIPIPVLRQAWLFFFNLIIFFKPAIVQTAICLILAAAVYATNLFYLKIRN